MVYAMRTVIIDTDTGSDDAVALVMAAKHPDLKIDAVTVVAGNVPLEQGVQNALYTLQLCMCRAPIYAGHSKPFLRPLQTAQEVHGADGMGDIGLPLKGREPNQGHAVNELCSRLMRGGREIFLVTLGPLTNIAAALRLCPEIAERVVECVIMGGTGRGPGNITSVAEFNIWVDPEAANAVFNSGMRLKMVGWEIASEFAYFGREDYERLRSVGTPLALFCADIQTSKIDVMKKRLNTGWFNLPDPIAMAVALKPDIVEESKVCRVDIATDEVFRGQTVVNHLEVPGKPLNVEIVTKVSRQGFLDMLFDAIG